MWSVFGQPLKKAVWKTPGLHAELTIRWRMLSVLGGACSACSLVLLLGIGAQDPSQSYIADIWGLQPILL